MSLVLYGALLLGFIYALFVIDVIRKREHSRRYPLPEWCFSLGLFSQFIPFYKEIQFAKYCWQHPEIDFTTHVYGLLEVLSKVLYNDGVYRLWIGGHPFVFASEPHTVEALLSSSEHIEKAQSYDLLHPWLGTGLLTSTGLKWRTHRKLLTPAFHFAILEDFVEIFNRQSQRLAQRLELEFAKGNKQFDIFAEASLCTLDIICESAMGTQVGAQGKSESSYVRAVNAVGAAFMKRIASPWLWPELFFRMSPHGKAFYKALNVLHTFTRQVVNERCASYKAGMSPANRTQTEVCGRRKKRAFLDLLIEKHYEDPDMLSIADIAEEVDTFMFEGHDTTATGISWCLYLLGQNPVWQQRVADEIISVVGTDPSTSITNEHLPKLKWLECAIKESQRLFPSVPMVGRKLREDLHLGGNRIVPAGSTAVVSIWHLHRRAELYKRPEDFMPERFYQGTEKIGDSQAQFELRSTIHPYAYVPFSAGPRNCIGQRFALMEEKIVLANVLRRLEVRSLTPRDKLHLNVSLITKPIGGLKMCVRSRENCPS